MRPYAACGTHLATGMLLLAALLAPAAAQSGPVTPNVTLPSGPERRVETAARFLLAQQSDIYAGLGVEYWESFCMDDEAEECPVGQRATVACRKGAEVYISFNSTKVIEGNTVPNTELLPSDKYEYLCTLDPVSECTPAFNEHVYGNFSNVKDDLAATITDKCLDDGVAEPTVVICTGETDNGGAYAALCGYWTTQTFPTTQVSVATFASKWAEFEVNMAFLGLYTRFVSYTVDNTQTAEDLLGSDMVRSSPGWVLFGDSCSESPYCTQNQAVNASCALKEDIESNGQFLESYPGAVIIYSQDPNSAQLEIKQSVAIMWVPDSSALVITFANHNVTAETINPDDFVSMESIWNPDKLLLAPEYYEPYQSYYVANTNAASDRAAELGEFQTGQPEVVSAYLNAFAEFDEQPSSKLQCSGIEGCYEYVSASSPPKIVVCSGHGVAGGVAGVCAAWAALRFPSAQVNWYNAGSPQPVGNDDFYRFVSDAVGNFNTMVNHLDPVPRAPSCAANASSMAIPSIATYYRNETGLTQAQDPFFSQVNCSYLMTPPAQRPPNTDSLCSSYLSEGVDASITVPIPLPPQVPFAPLPNDMDVLKAKWWQDAPLGLYS